MKIIRTPESFSIDDTDFATLMAKILTPFFSELAMSVKAEIQDVFDRVAALQEKVTGLHDSVETLKGQNTTLIAQTGSLITLTGTLKSLLEQALANSTLSEEDKAALKAAGDKAIEEATAIGTEITAVAGVSQSLGETAQQEADTVATKQPGN